MDKLTKAQLISGGRLKMETIQLPDGGAVTVRGLTRLEAAAIRDMTGDDSETRERRILTYGLVDPELTEAEVGQWMSNAAFDEITFVSMAIGRLSGLLEDSPREAFPGDGERPGPGV